MSLSTPQLHLPFASQLHPLTEAVHERTLAWADDFGLLKAQDRRGQLHAGRYTWLVGRFFPQAEPRELQLISDFTSWLFWNDDVCDESGEGDEPRRLAQRFRRYFELLRGTVRAQRRMPFEHALEDLRERFDAAAPSDGWLVRFIAAVRDYFDACVWEAQNRAQGSVPDVGSYVAMRRYAGGMYIYLEFLELVNGAELPLLARRHPSVVRLARAANDVASWTNDLYSLRKELLRDDVHNLVVCIAIERRLSLRAAFTHAVHVINAEVHRFLARRETLPTVARDVAVLLEHHVEGLTTLMRGNLDWSRESGRYAESELLPEGALERLIARLRSTGAGHVRASCSPESLARVHDRHGP